MLVFALIATLATVVLVGWVTLVVSRGRVELLATKALAGVRGAASLRSARSQAPADADRTGGGERDVELAVRERLYGQRAPRT
jgi:hypothetical protein